MRHIVDVIKEIIRAALFLACGAALVWYLVVPMFAMLDVLLTEARATRLFELHIL